MPLRYARPLLFFVVSLPLAFSARAQRTGGAGPPAQDPFGRRVVAARAVPGGRYAGHQYKYAELLISSTDGATVSVSGWMPGVVRVEYRAPDANYWSPEPDSSRFPTFGEEDAGSNSGWGPALGDGYLGEPHLDPGLYYNRAMSHNHSVSVVGGGFNRKKDAITAHRSTKLTDEAQRGVLRLQLGTAAGRKPRADEPAITVVVRKNPLRVSVLRGTDTLVAEAAGAFRRLAPPPAAAQTSAAAVTFAPGGTAVRFRLAPGERLYGTGSRALPLDRRGYRLELYNQAHYASQNGEPNLNIALPTVLSSRGYLLLFDNHKAGYLDLGKADKNVLEYGGENLNSLCYYVVTGRNQAEILNRYTALTGRQPLPPRWALGLIQSRFGYRSDAEMQQVADRMRRENFPLDALVLDLYWFGGTTRQGDFAWDARHFPDPAGMMARLNQQGVKTILISEPYVMRTSRNDSLVRTQRLVGTTAAGGPFTVASFWAGPASILDVFKPQARDWLWGHYRALHNQGAAGWWSDLGEPENHPDAMRHAAGPTRAVHNAYGQVWASIFRDRYAQEFPTERVFNLARSGWAGMQRNAVFPWSGDINRSWSGYQAQIPVMLGMGQGGVGYMHSDAGGFCVGGIDPELYTRWLQLASLCPILRPHGEGVPPEPYYYPNPYKSSVRDAVHLRYQLLPYLYTLAWLNTTTGAPLARTMDFDAPLNEELGMRNEELSPGNSSFLIPNSSLSGASNDQYLLGPNLLVAPVLHPGQRRRNVVLPAGNWVDFYSNQTYAGGQTVGVVAPLAHAPLLVRAGAFLPMTAYRPSTARYRPDTLQLRYYPDAGAPRTSFTVYDDDGHSAPALAQNEFELLTLRGTYAPAETTIQFAANGGHYPGQPARHTVQLLVPRVAAAPAAVLLDGQPLPPAAVAYDPARRELRVEFSLPAPAATLSLRGLRLAPAPAPAPDPETLTLEAPASRSFGPGGTTLPYTRHPGGRADAPQLLAIRNAQGGIVRVLALADAAPGPHALAWDGRDEARRPVPPGVYTAEAGEQHQRLIVTP